MASKHFLTNKFLILIVLFFSYHSQAIPKTTSNNNNNVNKTSHNNNEAICNSTPYPSICLSNLPNNHSGNIHDYARFFLAKSQTIAANLLSTLDAFLKHRRLNLSVPAFRAVEDCRLLAELTLDNIAQTQQAINFTNSLDPVESEDLQTLLSAVLTNQQTCLEGLEEANITSSPIVRSVLNIPLTFGTKLYSISLALFKHGWVDDCNDDDDDKDTDDASCTDTTTKAHHHLRKLLQNIVDNGGPNLGGLSVSGMGVVNQSGTGNFTTISEAVNAAPDSSAVGTGFNGKSTYFVIYVVRGVYEEYVSIGRNKHNLMMIGDGIDQTVITGNRSVLDGWTTFDSATFAVAGQGFVAINITFRNTAGAAKHQAVALRNSADHSAFHGCSFEGYQDTLYAHSLRQFYRDCHVHGTVDFIFGNAAAVLQNCRIHVRLPLPGQFNTLTAQGRSDPNQNTGTSIHNCLVEASPVLASAGPGRVIRTFLGRPWREYSRTVFMQSFLGDLVDPAGWSEWSGSFALSTLYYAEFNNTGPGADTSMRVAWPGCFPAISVADATNFTVSNFIAGDAWLPQTSGVPYTGGLLV